MCGCSNVNWQHDDVGLGIGLRVTRAARSIIVEVSTFLENDRLERAWQSSKNRSVTSSPPHPTASSSTPAMPEAPGALGSPSHSRKRYAQPNNPTILYPPHLPNHLIPRSISPLSKPTTPTASLLQTKPLFPSTSILSSARPSLSHRDLRRHNSIG